MEALLVMKNLSNLSFLYLFVSTLALANMQTQSKSIFAKRIVTPVDKFGRIKRFPDFKISVFLQTLYNNVQLLSISQIGCLLLEKQPKECPP
jgi:hypothetical protein